MAHDRVLQHASFGQFLRCGQPEDAALDGGDDSHAMGSMVSWIYITCFYKVTDATMLAALSIDCPRLCLITAVRMVMGGMVEMPLGLRSSNFAQLLLLLLLLLMLITCVPGYVRHEWPMVG